MNKMSKGMLGMLFFAGSMLNAQSSVAQLEHDLAQLRLVQARQAFSQNQIDIAHHLLHQSSEFSDNSIDYYELHGLILLHDRRYKSAMDSFEKALDFPQELHRSLESEHQLFALYYRAGLYDKVLSLSQNSSLLTADAFFYRNLALAQQRSDTLLTATKEAMALWPHDYRFYLPVLDHEQFDELFLPNFTLLSQRALRNQDEELTPEERSLFIASLRRITGDNQLALIEVAQPWLAVDLNYALLRRWVSYHKAQAAYELLVAEDAAVVIEPIVPMALPAGLEAEFINIELLMPHDDLAFVGRSSQLWVTDRNKDGYVDAWGRLQMVVRGDSYQWLPMFWVEDAAQMGQPMRAVFYRANGQPYYVMEQHDHSLVSMIIEDFPYVSQVRIENLSAPAEITEELILNQMQEDALRTRRANWLISASPRSLVYKIALASLPLEYAPAGLQVLGLNSVAVPSFTQAEPLLTQVNLMAVSYRMHEYIDNQLFRLLQIVDGQVVALWEDSGQEGFFSRFLAFKDGVPLYGKRALMRGEGYVLYEHYENGTWQGTAFTDGSPIFDFYEEWGADSLHLKVWDFEPDGYINAYTAAAGYPEELVEVQANLSSERMPISAKIAWDFAQATQWFNEQRD